MYGINCSHLCRVAPSLAPAVVSHLCLDHGGLARGTWRWDSRPNFSPGGGSPSGRATGGPALPQQQLKNLKTLGDQQQLLLDVDVLCFVICLYCVFHLPPLTPPGPPLTPPGPPNSILCTLPLKIILVVDSICFMHYLTSCARLARLVMYLLIYVLHPCLHYIPALLTNMFTYDDVSVEKCLRRGLPLGSTSTEALLPSRKLHRERKSVASECQGVRHVGGEDGVFQASCISGYLDW
eukprot:scaffold5563_cov31-Tisochrysis_lutea.AAC.1